MEKYISRLWGHISGFYNYGKIDATLKDALPYAGHRTAFGLLSLAGFLLSMISILVLLESVYLVNLASDLASEVTDLEVRILGFEYILPYILLNLLFNAPVFILFSYIFERIVYLVCRATGGKGTFDQQFYLSSLITLSLVLAYTLGFAVPLPCINVLAVVGLLILTVYLLLIVNAKAYAFVHDLSFLHGFLVATAALMMKIAVFYFASEIGAGIFGLPAGLGSEGG